MERDTTTWLSLTSTCRTRKRRWMKDGGLWRFIRGACCTRETTWFFRCTPAILTPRPPQRGGWSRRIQPTIQCMCRWRLQRSEDRAALAARVLIRLGKDRKAAAVAADLGAQLQPQSRAYGKILEGEIALRQRRTIEAIEAFRAAEKLTDLWLGRFDSGIAYVQAGQYAEALSDLELCQKRSGEAVAIFFDELPSFRYLTPLAYWLGRAKDELGMKPAAIEHYKAFLAARPSASKDPLVIDARRRVGSL